MSKKNRPEIGVLLHGSSPAITIKDFAQKVEKAGFAEFWVSEDYFMLSGFASAGIALASTKTIRVGLGAVSGVVRHPAVTAMETATLSNAFPGRFELAIGHGLPLWTKQMGVHPKSPLKSMRESVSAIKRLLKGETITETGDYFTFQDVMLLHPAPDQKILTAVVGPKSIDLTAEIADGVLISVLAGPNYIKQTRERMDSVCKDKGIPIVSGLPVYVFANVDETPGKAREKIRPILAFYLAAMGPTDLTGSYGINDHLVDMINRGGQDVIAKEMPEDWLDWLAVSGTPDQCINQIHALGAAGATSVVLALVADGADEINQQVQLIEKHIIPALDQ